MILIYSNTKIEGLEGAYRNHAFFDGVEEGAEVVYTDDKRIKEAYAAKEIEVKALPKKGQGTTKKGK